MAVARIKRVRGPMESPETGKNTFKSGRRSPMIWKRTLASEEHLRKTQDLPINLAQSQITHWVGLGQRNPNINFPHADTPHPQYSIGSRPSLDNGGNPKYLSAIAKVWPAHQWPCVKSWDLTTRRQTYAPTRQRPCRQSGHLPMPWGR